MSKVTIMVTVEADPDPGAAVDPVLAAVPVLVDALTDKAGELLPDLRVHTKACFEQTTGTTVAP